MDVLIERFLDALKHERRSSLNTLQSYSSDLKSFEEYILKASSSVQKADHKLLRRYLSFLSTLGLGSRTIARRTSTLKSFYKYLCRQDIVSVDPTSALSYPKIPKRLPRILTENEIDGFMKSVCGASRPSARDIAIIELLYGCGLRVSELTALDLENIDLNKGTVRIFGKGSKERVVPLTHVAIEATEVYLSSERAAKELLTQPRSNTALFLNRSGVRLSSQGVRRLLEKYSRLAGMQRKINPHLLRHCLATHFLERGADLRIVQEILGHSDLSSTQVYTQMTKKQVRSVYKKSHPRA